MPGGTTEAAVQRVAELLAGARSALFITGAGVSADSGLPTYRGVGGLYEHASAEGDLPIEEALSGRVFRTRPELTWRHILQVERACRGSVPNQAHWAIAHLERRMRRVWVLTQNVDGLHRLAGSTHVIEVHGNLQNLMCTQCVWRTTVEDYAGLEMPPSCPECGCVIRPEVVLFGEELPRDAMHALSRELSRGFDIVLSVGTSNLFPYIAQPVIEARSAGVPTVEINPGTTTLSTLVDHRLIGRAAPTLDAILRAYLRQRGG